MEGVKKERRTMPFWMGIVCIVLAVTSLTVTALAAVQNFQVALPVIGDIQFVESKLAIEGVTFNYNSSTKQYYSLYVTVRNSDTKDHTAKIEVYLYTTTNAIVASGFIEAASINGGGTDSKLIYLTWQTGHTILNCSRSEIQVIQTE